MTLMYIPADVISPLQLAQLAASYAAGPRWEHQSAEDIREMLAQGYHAFGVGGRGLMLVRVADTGKGRILVLEAAHVRLPWIRGWVRDMRRLASDWGCDAVETLCYTPRLARAMMLCGVKVKALALKLEV